MGEQVLEHERDPGPDADPNASTSSCSRCGTKPSRSATRVPCHRTGTTRLPSPVPRATAGSSKLHGLGADVHRRDDLLDVAGKVVGGREHGFRQARRPGRQLQHGDTGIGMRLDIAGNRQTRPAGKHMAVARYKRCGADDCPRAKRSRRRAHAPAPSFQGRRAESACPIAAPRGERR